MAPLARRSLLFSQVAATLVLLAVLMLWPPARGRMMIVPLYHAGLGAAVEAALAGGATVLGRGPLAESIVVEGERNRLAARAAPWRLLVMASPPAGCGSWETVS